MKQGWEIKPFEEILEKVKYSKKIPKQQYKKRGTYPIVSQEQEIISGFWDEKNDLFRLNKPIVIFGDHTKVVKYIDFDFVIGADGVKILSPTEEILTKYLYYFVLSVNLRDLGYARHFRLLKEQKIPVPSLLEQGRIVGVLDAVFAKIDALKENAQKNLENAKTLFQQVLKQELTPKPNWQTKKLSDISKNLDTIRKPVTKKDRVRGEYPYYGASGIVDYVDGYLFDEDLLLISEDGANLLARSTPIAFSISGKTWVNNHAHVLKFNNSITQKYVELYIESIPIDGFVTGMVQPKLTQKSLYKIPIPIPETISEQQQIVSKIKSFKIKSLKVIANAEKTIAECDALKQAVLRRAFNGEL